MHLNHDLGHLHDLFSLLRGYVCFEFRNNVRVLRILDQVVVLQRIVDPVVEFRFPVLGILNIAPLIRPDRIVAPTVCGEHGVVPLLIGVFQQGDEALAIQRIVGLEAAQLQ